MIGVTTSMMRHMNGISAHLTEQPDSFEPIFLERVAGGRTHTIVDEWCEGYYRGVELAAREWLAGGQEIMDLLAPIYAFTEVADWRAHDLGEDEVKAMQEIIAPNVREIHAFWLDRRKGYRSAAGPVRRRGARVGRNDPCPCGSGKKYKKCCMP